MDPLFWLDRWEKREIGFHQADFNPHLQQFWPGLNVSRGAAVFVPLCGKSADMAWLRDQGHLVWGIEVSPLAVAEFFDERGLRPQRCVVRDLTLYRADRYNIYCGDFFRMRPAHLRGIGAVYDRASLVALPPSLRRRYARHLCDLLAPGTRSLLVSVDYPPNQMEGPPFPVDDAEVRALFEREFEVRSLLAVNVLDQNPRFRARGLTRLEDRVYCLTRR